MDNWLQKMAAAGAAAGKAHADRLWEIANTPPKIDPNAFIQGAEDFGNSFMSNLGKAPGTIFGADSPIGHAMEGVMQSSPVKAVTSTAQAFGQGVGQVYQGGQELGNAMIGIGPNGEQLSPEQRLYQGARAVADVGGGAMGAMFAPAAGTNEVVPGAKEVTGAIGLGLNKISKAAAGTLTSALKIDPKSEQALTLQKLFGTLTPALALELATKAGELLKKNPVSELNKSTDAATRGIDALETPQIKAVSQYVASQNGGVSPDIAGVDWYQYDGEEPVTLSNETLAKINSQAGVIQPGTETIPPEASTIPEPKAEIVPPETPSTEAVGKDMQEGRPNTKVGDMTNIPHPTTYPITNLEDAIKTAKQAIEIQKKTLAPEYYENYIIYKNNYTGQTEVVGESNFNGTSSGGVMPSGGPTDGTVLATVTPKGKVILP